MERRTFARLLTAAAGAAVAPALARGDAASPPQAPEADRLQSEFLFDFTIERGTANNVGGPGANRVVVPVMGGTFAGPKLKGTVAGPAGDWITVRSDGSSALDLRVILQTDDAQKIYMKSRGVAYTLPDGALFARILPVFETGAANYAYLNDVVAVGVYRQVPGKVAYRVYRIL
jgi:Protein of unknown function (DUF3237)